MRTKKCVNAPPLVSRIANLPAERLRMAPMPTVAEQLRTAREARNLTVHEVAETTKIRTDHIRALESGDYDVFTAPVYIRGFVRTYSTLLKLDVPQIMAALDGELGRTEKFSEPPPLSSEPRGALDFVMLQLSRVNWQKGLVVIIGGVLMLILLVFIWAWRKHRTRDPLSDLPPAIYQTPPQQSGETLPLPAPPASK
jgi:cytoskeletal protein RodZ